MNPEHTHTHALDRPAMAPISLLYYQAPSHPYMGTNPITSLLWEKKQIFKAYSYSVYVKKGAQ